MTNIIKSIRKYFEKVKARNALHRLSDRELHDIGISRSEIESVIR